MPTPQIHTIVTTGGLNSKGCRISSKKGGKKLGFLFPIRAMNKVFRAVWSII